MPGEGATLDSVVERLNERLPFDIRVMSLYRYAAYCIRLVRKMFDDLRMRHTFGVEVLTFPTVPIHLLKCTGMTCA